MRTQVTSTLPELVQRADALLLGFDGPVADVFVDYSTEQVALGLRRCLEHRGVVPPAAPSEEDDPWDVLRWVGDHRSDLTLEVGTFLTGAECLAVETAQPTAGAFDVIRAAHSVAIISDNSELAIHAYLQDHGMLEEVDVVVGRPFGDPGRRTPCPAAVTNAVDALGVCADRCVFVSDCTADIRAARSVGVHPIGYAGTPQQLMSLRTAGAEAIVNHMSELASALRVAA